jgi:sporulation protein YlmC with PRC-barrel domain
LKEGAEVISLEGETVGKIKEMRVDPDKERVTHIVVEEGLFFPDRKILPTIWLTNVFENEVHLAMKSSTLERLPEYEE